MAEKGGKGFSVSKGKKSATKSSSKKEVPLKGKDDSSLKGKDSSSLKKGRRVHFDASDSEESPRANINDSLKSGGKASFASPATKGDWSKGGKSDKTGKSGGKSAVPKEPSKPEFKIEAELPKNATCLLDCEAADILQRIQEQLGILSADPKIKIPESFDKAFQYAKTSSHYTSPNSVKRVLETLKRHGVSDGEICMIANTCPESVDEVFALIPSLKGKRRMVEEPIKNVLFELAKLKHVK